MSSAQTATLVSVTASVTAIVALVLTGVPFLARQTFRARLAQIRDDTADAVLDGRLRRGAAVDALLGTLMLTVDRVCSASLADNVLTALAYCGRGISRPTAQLFIGNVACLNPAEREIMRELGTRACDAHQSFIIWASPVGWLIAPAVLLGRRFAPVTQPAHARGQGTAARRRPAPGIPGNVGPHDRNPPHQGSHEVSYPPRQRSVPVDHVQLATNPKHREIGMPEQVGRAPARN